MNPSFPSWGSSPALRNSSLNPNPSANNIRKPLETPTGMKNACMSGQSCLVVFTYDDERNTCVVTAEGTARGPSEVAKYSLKISGPKSRSRTKDNGCSIMKGKRDVPPWSCRFCPTGRSILGLICSGIDNKQASDYRIKVSGLLTLPS